MLRNGTIALLLVAVARMAHAESSSGSLTPAGPSLQDAIRVEVARFTEADGASARQPQASPATQPRSWVKRHPVRTAAIVGAASGFLVGYLPGDDAVFDDFTAGFNGTVVGAMGAGGAAAVVAIVQALRRPLPGR